MCSDPLLCPSACLEAATTRSPLLQAVLVAALAAVLAVYHMQRCQVATAPR
jgi:hypothetical protein